MVALTTEQKRLKGTLQKCRTNLNEPKLLPGIPEMPPELTRSAKKYWPIIIAHLRAMGTMTTTDQLVVAGLAQCMGDLLDTRKSLKAHGGALTYQNEKGQWNPYPEIAILNALNARYVNFLGRLGLTPADRAKVSAIVKHEPDDDGLRQFMN